MTARPRFRPGADGTTMIAPRTRDGYDGNHTIRRGITPRDPGGVSLRNVSGVSETNGVQGFPDR